MQIILVVLQAPRENRKKIIKKSVVWNPVTECAWVYMKGVSEFCWFIRERKEYFFFPQYQTQTLSF
jgi:predicted nucleotidyltransferase